MIGFILLPTPFEYRRYFTFRDKTQIYEKKIGMRLYNYCKLLKEICPAKLTQDLLLILQTCPQSFFTIHSEQKAFTQLKRFI